MAESESTLLLNNSLHLVNSPKGLGVYHLCCPCYSCILRSVDSSIQKPPDRTVLY